MTKQAVKELVALLVTILGKEYSSENLESIFKVCVCVCVCVCLCEGRGEGVTVCAAPPPALGAVGAVN